MKKIFNVTLLFLLIAKSHSTCSVENGFTTGDGTQPSTILFNPNLNFAYVILRATNQILPYSYDKYLGKLKRLYGYEVSSGGISPGFGASISSDGRYFYVPNAGTSSISVFAIDKNSGRLNLIQVVNSKYLYPYGVTISPDSKYAYVSAFNSGMILMYKIDQGNGTLSPLITSQHPGGFVTTVIQPSVTSFSPTGNYLYVPGYSDSIIVRFKYESSNGDLTPDPNWSINDSLQKPYGVIFDYNNTHAIIPADARNELRLYNFSNDNFTENPIQKSISTGITPNTFIQWYSNNRYSYMGNYGDSTISEYSYSSDGTMKQIGTLRTISRPTVVRQPSDPSNNHLFILSRDENCIADYSVNDKTGLLEPRYVNTNANVN